MIETTTAGGDRPPLRVISIAWGRGYVEQFLELCLPSLLAPGNLPALAEHFSVEIVFVTETEFFDMIRAHPSCARALRLGRFRLVPIDDLVATRKSYGMTLTYAFFRGFQDLGLAMTDYYLAFIHADFVLADGSYRNLLPHLLRGERLVFSPSYCVVSEQVRPALLALKQPSEPVLAVPPRQMADMVVKNRHFTVRGKTANQRFFSMKYIEQFYWIVDECTLLARQLPIALVAMKPERPQADVVAYWDYGMVAEFCPSMKFTVLGDSDDFLMLELRGQDIAKLELSLGWPSPRDIAAWLATIATDYQKVLGQARLTVHSKDLPRGVEGAHAELDRLLAAVYANLPEKSLPHLAHPQWTHHYGSFHEARTAFLLLDPQILSAAVEVPAAGGLEVPIAGQNAGAPLIPGSLREKVETRTARAYGRFRDALELLIVESADLLPSAPAERFAHALRALAGYMEEILKFESERSEFVRSWFEDPISLASAHGGGGGARYAIGSFSDVERRKQYILGRVGEIAHLVSLFEQSLLMADDAANEFFLHEVRRQRAEVRALTDLARHAEVVLGEAYPRSRPVARRGPAAARQLSGAFTPRGAEGETRGRLYKAYYALFGRPPHYRPWHWLQSSTRIATESVLRHVTPDGDVMLVSDGSNRYWHVAGQARSVLRVSRAALRYRGLRHEVAEGQLFDYCLIEADCASLEHFRTMYDQVRPFLRPSAVLTALFYNENLEKIPLRDSGFVRATFPVCGSARIAYSGSWASVACFQIRLWTFELLAWRFRVPQRSAALVGVLVAAPFALIGSVIESRRTLDNSYNPPRTITGVTIEIKIG